MEFTEREDLNTDQIRYIQARLYWMLFFLLLSSHIDRSIEKSSPRFPF